MSEDDPLSSLTLYDSSASSDTTTPTALRQQKLAQTEPQFLLQKSSWHPQDDIALAHARLTLPLTSPSLISTPENLKIRAEQEYYHRRYTDALGSAREALRRMEMRGEDGGGRAAEGEKREVRELVRRCEMRIGMHAGEGEGEGEGKKT